jgi:hypothetical protein
MPRVEKATPRKFSYNSSYGRIMLTPGGIVRCMRYSTRRQPWYRLNTKLTKACDPSILVQILGCGSRHIWTVRHGLQREVLAASTRL